MTTFDTHVRSIHASFTMWYNSPEETKANVSVTYRGRNFGSIDRVSYLGGPILGLVGA